MSPFYRTVALKKKTYCKKAKQIAYWPSGNESWFNTVSASDAFPSSVLSFCLMPCRDTDSHLSSSTSVRFYPHDLVSTQPVSCSYSVYSVWETQWARLSERLETARLTEACSHMQNIFFIHVSCFNLFAYLCILFLALCTMYSCFMFFFNSFPLVLAFLLSLSLPFLVTSHQKQIILNQFWNHYTAYQFAP